MPPRCPCSDKNGPCMAFLRRACVDTFNPLNSPGDEGHGGLERLRSFSQGHTHLRNAGLAHKALHSISKAADLEGKIVLALSQCVGRAWG